MLVMMEEEQEVWRIGNPDIFMLPQLMVVFPMGRPAKSVAPPVVLSSKIRVGSKDYVGGIHLHGQPGMAPPACSDPCALVSSSLLRLLTAKATLVTSNSL
jgi:hypothetical protein